MICPYNDSKAEQVHQDTYTYDEEGRVTFHEQKLVEAHTHLVCQEELCALYRDNQCCYNLTQLDNWIGFEGLSGCEDEAET